jgi:hypothetical protein
LLRVDFSGAFAIIPSRIRIAGHTWVQRATPTICDKIAA